MKDIEIIRELLNASKWFAEHGRNTNTAIIGICDRAVDIINRLKAEIDSLKIANEKMYDANKSQEAEIERLQGYKEIYEGLKAEYLETIKIIGQVKSEAIKEFAERLKKLKAQIFFEDGSQRVVYLSDIDKLVKEFTEEQK